MTANARRVVLLARAGVAGQRLAEVLDEAGCECVLNADPVSVDAATVLAAQPQTVVFALDSVTEDVLDHFGDVLSSPTIDVIYEEAELAATREGWDAARWRRHLVAKLHGHGDVLPPAGARAAAPVATTIVASVPFDIAEDADTGTPVPPQADDMSAHVGAPASVLALEPQADEVVVDTSIDAGAVLHEWTLDGVYEEAVAEESTQAEAGFNAFDPVMAEVAETGAAAPSILAVEGLAGMDLVADEAAPASTPAARSSLGEDMAALELRIASLTLVDDTPRRGAEPIRGAVLILAGIGGPDAVRQLLTGLPSDFKRPVLVQQRLEGARYDRLVAQMQRATSLPVQLAEPGVAAQAGTIYILSEAVGVESDDAGIRFTAQAGNALTALPAGSSAVLVLSGADPACVEDALGFGWAGGLVVGQSLDGCYDAAAASELAARGAFTAKPSEMVQRMLDHWRHET